VTVKFSQGIEDWNKANDPFQNIEYPSRRCKQEDFGNDPKDIEYHTSWKDFNLFCLDSSYDRNEELALQGVLGATVKKTIIITVEKCQNTTNHNNCKSLEQIDSFLKGVTIE